MLPHNRPKYEDGEKNGKDYLMSMGFEPSDIFTMDTEIDWTGRVRTKFRFISEQARELGKDLPYLSFATGKAIGELGGQGSWVESMSAGAIRNWTSAAYEFIAKNYSNGKITDITPSHPNVSAT